jgi:hypothetical protein
MFGILLPICLLISGIFALIYRQQAGLLFCRVGKAIWRVSTFGLTDMHWFYPEDRAPRIGVQLGLILCLFGIIFGSFSTLSLSGPNSFAAMYQAQTYLKKTYGDSNDGYSLSSKAIPGAANDVIVHYEYSGKVGNLRASWDGKKYNFTAEP